jgi:outer membrane protein TolC
MLGKSSLSIGLLCSLNGCAATAGSTVSASLQNEYDRATPALARAPRTPATGSAREAGAAEVASAPVLDRAEYVRAVLRENPSIESARQGWRAAIARVHQAGAFEDPMVDLGIAPLSIGSSKAPLGWEVGVSQKLPWFGKRSLETSAAAAEAAAAKHDFEATQRELALTAINLYDQYFVAVRSLEINAEHVELMRAMRGGATAQFEAGRGSAQDPLQAESELARMEHDTVVLSSERDMVMAQMNELLHRDPGESLPPPPKELARPADPEVHDSKRLGEQAVTVRPDIAAMRERARAAQSRAERAGRDAYPDVTVSTSYNSMWDMPEHRWMVGLGFNLPIWTGARTGAADEATAMRAQFESDARRLEASARTQIFVSLKQLEESKHVLTVYEQRLLPVARDRIEAARAGFTASRNPFMAVVEAERNLRSIELDYQMARADCDRHHAELERALGLIPGISAEGSDR